jgi:hypothetical protein
MTPGETRWLQFVTARADRSATATLRQGLDHMAAREADQIVMHSGFLADLTRQELTEQAALTREVERFWTDPPGSRVARAAAMTLPARV